MKEKLYPELRKYLKENKILQKDLADKLGVSHITLHRYMTGKRKVPMSIKNLIQYITGIKLNS